MNSSQPQPDSPKLDAYLDGQLPPEERDAAAREIAASRELERAVELQSQIDASLRHSFAPPAMPSELVAKLREAAGPRDAAKLTPASRAKSRNWKLIAAITAAAAIVWGYLGWQFLAPDPSRPDYNPRKPLDAIYATTIAEGFKPLWKCENDAEFIDTFQKRHGQGLLLASAEMPAGTKMEGLTYVGGMSRYTTTMLARVDDKPVMVFVDRADSDYTPADPCNSCGLHLFRKQVGSLMLYELTPLDQPKLMEYLRLPDEKASPPSGAGKP
jgi:hypothetical protein